MAFIKGLIHRTDGGTPQGGTSGTTLHQAYKPAMSCKYSFEVQGSRSENGRHCHSVSFQLRNV
jgi:hypothetical protein